MLQETVQALEYDALREHLARHAQSPLGRARALSLKPLVDVAAIRTELGRSSEARRYLNEVGRFGLGGLADPESLLGRLRIAGISLEASELLDVGRYIQAGLDLRAAFTDLASEYPLLSGLASGLPDLSRSLAEIRAKILPTGEVDDSASPELRRIRRDIQRLRGEVQRSLERLMRDRAPDAIQDELITIRNGRFVVPVRSEFRGRVKGVMHGASSTGQTVYIEPLDTIDQNNELSALRDREEAEIAAILAALTDRLRAEGDAVERLSDGLGRLDFCAAKAHLSRQLDAIEPDMSEDGELELDAARHPLLEANLRGTGRAVVPISLGLGPERRTLVISGPNAGGKTVVLKTVGLLALMAQSGLHVPARSARLPVFVDVRVDIGDHQSLAANLSTFSAHVRNIASIIETLPTRALVLLDEIGTGTDPDEGAAIAISVLERLRAAGAYTIASTHYNRLKMYASRTEGVGNAAVEFDEATLQPTYRLLVGLAGSSSGVEIARRLGLQSDVVAAAEDLMSISDREAADYLRQLKSATDEANALRVALDEEREAVARKYTDLDLEFQRRERERASEFSRILEQSVRDFELEGRRLVTSAQDKTQQARLRKATEAGASRMRGEVRARVAALKPRASVAVEDAPVAHTVVLGPIEPGAEVLVRAMNQRGTVEAVTGDRVEVRMGMLKLRVSVAEVERVAASADGPSATRLPSNVRVDLASDDMVSSELNLIGCHTDEARDLLDKFLDEAFLGSLAEVRVVHGFGTGALKRAVAELLSRHPHVASFAPAPSSQGGGGATVVELRK